MSQVRHGRPGEACFMFYGGMVNVMLFVIFSRKVMEWLFYFRHGYVCFVCWAWLVYY